MRDTDDAIYRQKWLSRDIFRWPGVGRWGFVFLLKAALAWQGILTLQLALNMALIALLIIPLKSSGLNFLRHVLVGIALAALTYSESSLPPFQAALDNLGQMAQFSIGYWLELTRRYLDMAVISWLVVALVVYLYLANLIRVTPLVIIALLSTTLAQSQQAVEAPSLVASESTAQASEEETPSQFLQQFYQQQNTTTGLPGNFDIEQFNQSGTDILIVNICSLSWQDIQQSNIDSHPLFDDVDLILTQYNSVSSYSGPSALRVLQANCGQRPHSAIFQSARECLLAEQFAQVNGRAELLMNHDGEFDNFAALMQRQGGLSYQPASREGVPVSMLSFDGSPIYTDYEVMARWLQQRSDGNSLTFYNSISLHDGNRLIGSNLDSYESYGRRAERLLDDIMHLFEDIEQQQRNLLVLIVPEHGAGLGGDGVQLRGVREFPTPSLTHVPVLMKWFGPQQYEGEPIEVDARTSQSALTTLIYRTLQQRPYATDGSYSPQELASDINAIDWVSENKNAKVMEYQSQWLLKVGNQSWVPFEASR